MVPPDLSIGPGISQDSSGAAAFYRQRLLEGIVPFWLQHGIDRTHGGLLTCMDDTGRRQSTDKYLWSQGRGVWTFAALYRRVDPRPEFLDIARSTADFILHHGRDNNGDVVYRVGQAGGIIEGYTSVYSNLFAAYGLNELAQASGEARYHKFALDFLQRSFEELRQPFFGRIAPYRIPAGIAWVHGPPMICLEVANEIAAATGSPLAEEAVEWCLGRILHAHIRREPLTLLEHLTESDDFLDTPEGRIIVPGHAIESMWFVIHAALRLGKAEPVHLALQVIRRMLEAGWDECSGGLSLGLDYRKGGTPALANAEKKIWWVHTEALYALVLASRLTEEPWCREWYKRVSQWSFDHFENGTGEWIRGVDRDGKPITETVALPVKDPFHFPRALILIYQTLQRGRPLYG